MTSNPAKPTSNNASHWYYQDGKPCYELPKKDGSGMKVATLADARKLNLLPSVTTILKILHKEALVQWLIEQSVLAALTTPRPAEEPLDDFIYRVLHTERVQDQESTIAKDRGTEIHNALEALFAGNPISKEIDPWVRPAFEEISKRGRVLATEQVLVGDGYAGKTDLIQRVVSDIWLWDWKSTKKLPDPQKGAWSEHRLQLAAYAEAHSLIDIPPRTGNVYISTVDCGKFVVCEHNNWRDTYDYGFAPLVTHWQWSTGYKPAHNQ